MPFPVLLYFALIVAKVFSLMYDVFVFQHGACVNVADLWKFTPLHEAAAKGKFEICKLLLKVSDPYHT